MDEFALIELLTTSLDAARGAMGGVGDDAAILEVPHDKNLVVSTDTLVEGVHFEVGTAPADIGYKSLAVNLSDLAAMGAKPAWYFLALTLPVFEADWIREFARGMGELAAKAYTRLAGGDTTRGPLNVTVTVCGLVTPGQALTRGGARVGDIVGISGVTGLAGRALRDIQSGEEPAPACLAALIRPRPRVRLGQSLGGLASSCIDISDGLLADLGHIAKASCVGAELHLGRLPVPSELADLNEEDRWEIQLGGGDDYELCFTAAPGVWPLIREQAREAGADAIEIGKIVGGDRCTCLRPDGGEFRPGREGYVHGAPE